MRPIAIPDTAMSVAAPHGRRRTAFLMRDADTHPITFLLANAYHQGLADATEALTKGEKP